MIDPRRPNFAAAPASAVVPRLPAIDPESMGFSLLLSRGALLEPTAIEQLCWYLFSHPDAAAVTCFHIARDGEPRLDNAGAFDWPAILAGRSTPHVALLRTALLRELGEAARSDPRAALLALAERGLPCGTVTDFLCWGPVGPARAPAGSFPRLAAGQFPPLPRERSEAFEPVPAAPPADRRPTQPADRNSILFIVPWFTLGGADKFNLRLGEQLRARGWQLTFAATNRGDQSWLPDFTALTPDVHILPHIVRPDAGPLYLRHLIETRRPGVVLISNSELGYLCLPYLRFHCPQPVYLDYSHMEEPRWKNGGWSRYGAAWQDHLELNVVTSNHLKRWMISRGADESRVEVATINEDPALWVAPPTARVQFRAHHRIPADTGVILYAARICEQKKPHVFLRTVHALRDRGVNFVALVAGDGPDRHFLETYTRQHGLSSHVRFLLAVPPGEMPGVYAASDLLFLPSDREGIALVMFEAMAAGLPVVGAAVGGQPELVTPDCGLLHAPAPDDDEVRLYADSLAALLADPARRQRMGAAGRARIADHFSLDAMGDRMVGLFTRARELAETEPRATVTERTAQELATLAVEYLRADHTPPPPSLDVPLRYRLADRLNLALKNFGLSAPIKRFVSKATRAHRP